MSKTDKTKPSWVKKREPETAWLWSTRYTLMIASVYGDRPPRWFIDHIWNNPERVRERVELTKARHLYNNGEMDDGFDFANYSHRHRASWYWW